MADPLEVTLRIPGDWSHPGELLERLPDDVRLTPDALILPTGTEIEFIPMAPDEQFPEIFKSSCRRPAAAAELAIVDRYTVNVGLNGPGGSIESALTMMQAGAAIVRAGGAGVFIDNCGLAHGGRLWLQMTDDATPDAISFAFVSLVRGTQEMYTMGMHVLGFPDLLMRTADIGEQEETIVEIIRYVCGSGRPIGVGHLLADERGPRFQVIASTPDDLDPQSPMHNPFGRLKIASAKDVAEAN
ncbi:MAG: hypothetical protein ACKV0T_29295 [Planctomycetales bacterium]